MDDENKRFGNKDVPDFLNVSLPKDEFVSDDQNQLEDYKMKTADQAKAVDDFKGVSKS